MSLISLGIFCCNGSPPGDIAWALGDVRAAVELKYFRKQSNRAIEIDMCHVLRDLERLCGFHDYEIRRFACLTDNPYYANGMHSGHAGSVSIRHGAEYMAGIPIQPTRSGKWKDTSNDHPILLGSDVAFTWQKVGGWYCLAIGV